MTEKKELITSQDEIYACISSTVSKLEAAVCCTLGPRGKFAVLKPTPIQTHPHNQHGAISQTPIVTKDGVSVAKAVVLEDYYEQEVAKLVREASAQTARIAGDGTTTSMLLTAAITKQAIRNLTTGKRSSVGIVRGIQKAAEALIEHLHEQAVPCATNEQVKRVATISANGDDEIGSLIAEAYAKVGADGYVALEPAKGATSYVDSSTGGSFDRGYASAAFVTDKERDVSELGEAGASVAVLVSSVAINSIPQILPVLEKLVATKKPMIIIAPSFSDELLRGLSSNNARGILRIVAAHAPDFAEQRQRILEDLCYLTGAALVDDEHLTFEGVQLTDLGEVEQVVMTANSTSLQGGKGDADKIAERVAELRSELDEVVDDAFLAGKLEKRIARLTSGVAVVKIGAHTEASYKEKYDRAEDALSAVRTAATHGVVAGGGSALLHARQHLLDNGFMSGLSGDELVGAEIVLDAATAPFRKIVENAGGEPSVLLHKVLELSAKQGGYTAGYDAAVEVLRADMVADGVLDSVACTVAAVRNSATVAGTLLNIGAFVGG